MAGKFDISTKHLLDDYLRDLLPLGGRPTTAPTEIVESELSTVTAAADKVVLVREARPWVFHCEPQSYWEADLAARLNLYNAILEHRHGLEVRTVLLLLHRRADHSSLTGVYERAFPGEPPYRTFRYQVVRLWQVPVATLLGGGVGLLPLAPLGDVQEQDLPAVVRTMEQRIGREVQPGEAATLWTAAGLLMGLRWQPGLIADLLKGVHAMKESSFYQYILDEGRAEGRQEMLLEQGGAKFGPPGEETVRAIRAITDLARLRALSQRLLTAASWDELLAP